jgi:hypothetical protein
MQAFLLADVGEMGTEAWKTARMTHCVAWQFPASLLMATAFGMLMSFEPDELSDIDFRESVLHHAFIFFMTSSGLFSIKVIIDNMQDYFFLCNLPSKFLPDFVQHRDEFAQRYPCYVGMVARALRIPGHCDAFWFALGCFLVGIVCGVSVRYGGSYAVMLTPLCMFFLAMLKRTAQRHYLWPLRSFVCKEMGEHFEPPCSLSLLNLFS